MAPENSLAPPRSLAILPPLSRVDSEARGSFMRLPSSPSLWSALLVRLAFMRSSPSAPGIWRPPLLPSDHDAGNVHRETTERLALRHVRQRRPSARNTEQDQSTRESMTTTPLDPTVDARRNAGIQSARTSYHAHLLPIHEPDSHSAGGFDCPVSLERNVPAATQERRSRQAENRRARRAVFPGWLERPKESST